MTAPRVFRPGATLVSLFFWANLTGWGSVLAIQTGMKQQASGAEAAWLAYLMAAFGILFGPVAFLVHFVRFCLVSVAVDPEAGLVLSGGRKIPWSEIRSIELREAAFKGLLRINPLLLFFTAGCMAVIYYVILPSFALFTPWHRRVILLLGDGSTVVFRDLGGAEEFVEEVSRRIR